MRYSMNMKEAVERLKPSLGDTKATAKVLEEMVMMHLMGREVEGLAGIIVTTRDALPRRERKVFDKNAPTVAKFLSASKQA